MKIIRLNKENFNRIVEQASGIVKAGGLVIVPFDTVYGMICNPYDDTALEKIFRLKERSKDQTIGVAADNLESLSSISCPTKDQLAFIKDKIPGRYTFILPAKKTDISPYCLKEGTIAIRIPDSQLILAIAKLSGSVIAQTSANKTGKSSCQSIEEINNQFSAKELENIDLIIDGGPIESSGPSTILNLTKQKPDKLR